jgi:hypothetical protein
MTYHRILVCGGRDFTDQQLLESVLLKYININSIIIHGDAKGADTLADVFASKYKLSCWKFPARWDLFKYAAGPNRNARMFKESDPDLIIAFPGGTGTENMKNLVISNDYKKIEEELNAVVLSKM